MVSRSFTETEMSYWNTEHECLGVMSDLQKFEYYLLVRHVVVETHQMTLE